MAPSYHILKLYYIASGHLLYDDNFICIGHLKNLLTKSRRRRVAGGSDGGGPGAGDPDVGIEVQEQEERVVADC